MTTGKPEVTGPEISVFDHARIRGWPPHARGGHARVLPIERLLGTDFDTDAHFTAYASPNARRLTRGALDRGVRVTMTVVVFDIDCPQVHGTPEPAPQPWRTELLERIAVLSAAHPDPFVYMTRGGARILYAQPEPFVLTSQADAQRWTFHYSIAVAYLARSFGIIADPACKDWQRLFRMPHATRVRGGKPERHPVYGDPRKVGALVIRATHEDVATAEHRKKSAPRARRMLELAPFSSTGEGLFYHLLRAQGAIIRPHDADAYVIRCPNEKAHTSGVTGDTSTLLYRPGVGQSIGAIHCFHAHCSTLSVHEWLALFSERDIECARRDCVKGAA
jgi:hypothetical protein